MLTVEDVADELAIPAKTVRRLIRLRELAAVNVATGNGRIYRVSRAALDQYLRDHAVAS
jgi:excisionase family DNA binding protein